MALTVTIGSKNVTGDVDRITYSTVDPGGFEAAQVSLRAGVDPPALGAIVRIYEGLTVAWWGRVEEAGAADRDGRAPLEIGAVGHGAALKDDTYSMLYVDRDMSRWRPSTLARQISQASLSRPQGAINMQADATGLTWQLPPSSLANGEIDEMQYDAGPSLTVAYAMYRGRRQGSDWTKFEAANLYAGDTPSGAFDGYSLTADNTLRTTAAFSTVRRWLLMYVFNSSGAATTPAAGTVQSFDRFAAYGNHGLTRRAVASEVDGFYASDIARDVAVGTINGTTIAAGPIDTASSFIVQQAVYPRNTREEIVRDMGLAAGFHWGVWEPEGFEATPRFWFTSYPSAPTATVAREDCDRAPAPQRLSEVHNNIIVQYTDGDGLEQEASLLGIDHPLMPAGMSRDLVVSAGQATAATAAALAQLVAAQEIANAKGAGAVTLPAAVRVPGAGLKPACLLKAGRDRLRITDLPNPGPVTESDTRRFDTFRVRRTSTSAERGQQPVTTVELDAGLALTEVLQARMQAAGAAR